LISGIYIYDRAEHNVASGDWKKYLLMKVQIEAGPVFTDGMEKEARVFCNIFQASLIFGSKDNGLPMFAYSRKYCTNLKKNCNLQTL
jgi:hypothetical protein